MIQNAWSAIQDEHKVLLDAKEGLDDPAVLERSYLNQHLNEVITALVNEERDQRSRPRSHGQTEGPCFEFVIREEIIEHLCTLGLPDRPPGMRGLMTSALDSFFRQVRKPLLTHSNVHRAVRNFITVCVDRGDLGSKTARYRLVRLLKTLCLRLRDNPSLSFVFFEEYRQLTQQPEFIIFTTLLTLLNDDDVDANIAIQGLLCCVQLPEQRIASYIVNHTDFSSQLLLGLAKMYERLPETCGGGGGDDDDDGSSARQKNDDVFDDYIPLNQQGKFQKFMLRIALIDVIVQSTLPVLGDQICDMMMEFMNTRVRPQLLHVKEATSKWTTVYIRTILERVESTRLRHCVCEFLLSTTEPSSPRRTLIKRVDGLNEDMMVTTLGLIETLISFHDQWIMENLILSELKLDCSDDDDDVKPGYYDFQAVSREEIFSLFPRIQQRVADDERYEDYRLDAQDGVQAWYSSYDMWIPDSGLPAATTMATGGGESAEDDNEKPVERHLLLSCLFHKLELFYENSFRSNLRLTSVLAQLLCCPHNALHRYMLNPKHPPIPNMQSLLIILTELWHRGVKFAESMPDFDNRLQQVRFRLNGSDSTRMESQDEERNLQAFVVLEEFIKELVAINEAKNRVHDVNARCIQLQKLPVPGIHERRAHSPIIAPQPNISTDQ